MLQMNVRNVRKLVSFMVVSFGVLLRAEISSKLKPFSGEMAS